MADRHDEWPEGESRRAYGAGGGSAGTDYTGYRAGEDTERRSHDETLAGGELGAMARDADRGRHDATDADATPDPAALRADIRETRERLGDTLEELGERLNPSLLKHQVTQQVREQVRDATIGRVEHMARHAADRVSETRTTMMDTIRENPIPAAMAAIGLGWLFVNRSRRGSYPAGYADTGSSGTQGAYGARTPRDYDRQPGAAYYDAGAYVGGTYGGNAYAGGAYGGSGYPDDRGALDRARERAGDVGDQVRDSAGQLAERAQHLAGDVADTTRQRARQLEDRFYDQPLAVGAATLALGLAAGLSLPVTDREVQFMGDARDRLVDRVKDVADETRDKVQQVASRVVDEAQTVARQAAQEQGLAGQAGGQPGESAGLPGAGSAGLGAPGQDAGQSGTAGYGQSGYGQSGYPTGSAGYGGV